MSSQTIGNGQAVGYTMSVVDHVTIIRFDREVDRRHFDVHLIREGEVWVDPLDPDSAEWRDIEAWGGLPHA